MPFPSVTYSFTNSTAADATQVNTNFQNLVDALSDTTKDLSINALTLAGNLTVAGSTDLNGAVDVGTNVTYQLPAISWYKAPTTCLTWSDAATIQVASGRYFLNNKVYTNGSAINWTWAASGQNGGLDTGAEASSTWYYLYGTLIGGSFGVVASATAPTAVYDTNLSGASYDTNVYLGAFYNNGSSNIVRFWQAGATFMFLSGVTNVSHTGDTNFTVKTIIVPPTASIVIGRLGGTGTAGFEHEVSPLSSGGLSDYLCTTHVNSIANFVQVHVPISTAQTVYIKTNNAANTVSFLPLGWVDKWL